MIDRRRVVQVGLAAAGSLAVAAPMDVLAQAKPPVKVRYNEVVRSLLYAPAYVAITKGYFKDAGLDVALTTAFGSDSSSKIRIFSGLTSTDGFMLVGREKVDKFDWKMLKGKEILGFRPGSTPLLFLEEALRMNGIDPQKDVKLNNNVAIPARVGSWLAGQNQYAIFIEPDSSQLELDGKAHYLASIGQTVGFADYTSFMATDQYIKQNPEVVQTWTNAIYRAQKWTETAAIPELVSAIEQFFPGITQQALSAATARYQKLKIWKSSPVIDPKAIEKFQDILVNGNVLEKAKRVKFQDVVLTEFASKAK
jgi:NitT/TauT family transport system substrate-binding protein